MAIVASTGSGCSVGVWTDIDPLVDIGPRGDPGTVTILFVNRTAFEAVDVEFHATNEPLEVVPDDLFVAENLVTASIGVAGMGIIQPGRMDSIEFPCSGDLTIGTRGGTFRDNESGEQRGAGVARWAQEGPLALCGSLVTLRFSEDDGAFATTLTVSD